MWNMSRTRSLAPSWLTTSFSLLILAGPVAPARAATVVSETIWGTAGADGSAAVAVAADGSRYLAGTAFSDSGSDSRLFVVKFSADGSVVWQRAWVGGFFGASARGIAVAADGSVYVAGFAFVAPNAAILLKFDTDGALQWQRSWGGSAFPEAAVGADGTVFLAGNTNSFGSGSDDLFLLQLTPDGKAKNAFTWGSAVDPGSDF